MATPQSTVSLVETERANFRQLSISTLAADHQAILKRAVSRVLATDLAETTYAQIIDGLPLNTVVYDTQGRMPWRGHPIRYHSELRPAALAKAQEFRHDFDPETLQFDSRLLLAFQAAAPGSGAFNTRLVEIVAVAVHQLAVLLFQLDTGLPRDDSIANWALPKSDEDFWKIWPNGPPIPTLFNHPWYIDHEQYPNRVADIVGYWAENRILGGVVLFDRSNEYNADPNAIYFHSNRKMATYRIYRLLPEQKKALLDFLTSDIETCPLPILGDKKNMDRVDPEEPIGLTLVYRDIWERKDIPLGEYDARTRDVWSGFDYPTLADRHASSHRGWDRKRRYLATRRSSPPEESD